MASSTPLLVMVPFVLVLAACGGDAPDRRPLGDEAGGSGLPGGVQAQVDSGNAAYRAGDPASALEHYRRAARIDADVAAPWFGIVMAAGALGDEAAADSARARLRAIDPELAAGVHGGADALPADHPPIGASGSSDGAAMPAGHPDVPVTVPQLPADHP